MKRPRIYMDNNATTALRSEVKQLLIERLDMFANASSMHEEGRQAAKLLEQARSQVADLIAAQSEEILFTSGGSESNNMVFQAMRKEGEKRGRKEIIISTIEHPCVLNAAAELEKSGFTLIRLPVDAAGMVDISAYTSALSYKTLLVSIMLANNEIGSIQNIPLLAAQAHKVGALFHTDAVQAVGKLPVSVQELGVDYLSLSAHKIYGPKGVGALYHKKHSPLEPLIRGGHQEGGLRAGTSNTTAIYGFGLAAELAKKELAEYDKKMTELREYFKTELLKAVPAIRINGHESQVLPNTLNVSFPGAEGEAILLHLDLLGIAASTGSACASGSLDPSHVLMATGLGPELSHGSIRFSMGRDTTKDEIDYILENVPGVIATLRAMSTVS